MDEKSPLLQSEQNNRRYFTSGLSITFAIICIVDVFGVYPIISLPKSIIDCGYYGIFVVLSVSSIQIYTAILLGRCWSIAENIDSSIQKKNRYPYSALAELTCGLRFSKFVTFLLDVTIFGGGIPNLILASQNLQILGMRVSENTFNLSFCYWIIIMGTILCPLLWIGSPKDMKLICTISVIMVITVFLLVLGCIIFDFNPASQDEINPSVIPAMPFWQNLMAAYGILVFQFDIHPSILTIQMDMLKRSEVKYAIIGGFLASIGMFSAVTIAASVKYGSETHRSLLGTLPSSISLHFSALLVAMQLGLTSAVSNNALYQHMEDCLGISSEFNHRRCLLRTSLSVIAIVLAESVPRLDVIMSLIGGTFIGPIAFILPPVFYIKIMYMKKAHFENLKIDNFTNVVYKTPRLLEPETHAEVITVVENKFRILEIILCVFIILFGVCSTAVTTYMNVKNMVEFTAFTQPCLFNLTIF